MNLEVRHKLWVISSFSIETSKAINVRDPNAGLGRFKFWRESLKKEFEHPVAKSLSILSTQQKEILFQMLMAREHWLLNPTFKSNAEMMEHLQKINPLRTLFTENAFKGLEHPFSHLGKAYALIHWLDSSEKAIKYKAPLGISNEMLERYNTSTWSLYNQESKLDFIKNEFVSLIDLEIENFRSFFRAEFPLDRNARALSLLQVWIEKKSRNKNQVLVIPRMLFLWLTKRI